MFTRNIEKIEKDYKAAKYISEDEKVEKWVQATKRTKIGPFPVYEKSESIYTNKQIIIATGFLGIDKVPYANITAIKTAKMYFFLNMIIDIEYTDEKGKTKRLAWATQKRNELIDYIEEKRKANK